MAIRQSAPTTVFMIPCAVPIVMVAFSRIVVRAPISTVAGSPAYLRSRAGPRRPRRREDTDVLAQRRAAGDVRMRPDLAASTHHHVLTDRRKRVDVRAGVHLRTRVDDG